MSPSPETTELYRELRGRARSVASYLERVAGTFSGDARRGEQTHRTLVLVGVARVGPHELPMEVALRVPLDMSTAELRIGARRCEPAGSEKFAPSRF